MYESALELLKSIESLGHVAYIVGGYARDKYLNIESNDIDICTSASPTFLASHFDVIKDNRRFGSLVINYNDFDFEVTTFRKDIYENSRFPRIEYVDTLLEDLQRRDFTINTLCIDSNGEYIDLMGSREDIDNKIIRCIYNPKLSLTHDPLRIIRAVRFSINLGFNIEENLYEQMKILIELISTVSKRRIDIEMDKININEEYYKLIENLDLNKYLK